MWHDLHVDLSLMCICVCGGCCARRESIQAFSEGVSGTNARDVMDLLILTQYFDALQVRCCYCLLLYGHLGHGVCVDVKLLLFIFACLRIICRRWAHVETTRQYSFPATAILSGAGCLRLMPLFKCDEEEQGALSLCSVCHCRAMFLV